MNENRIQTENSISEGSMGKGKSNVKSGLIITGITCFLIIIASIVGVMYYFNAQSKKKDAVLRVNTLCDEISSVDAEIGESGIYNLEEKLKEVDLIIKNNNLDGIYADKYSHCKDYIDDIKLYKKIEKAAKSKNEEEFKDVQRNINALKTDSVRAKIDESVLSDIEETVRLRILYNTLKYYEERINESIEVTSESGVCQSYYYTVPTEINRDFFLSIPDFQRMSADTEGFDCITRYDVSFEKACEDKYVNEEREMNILPLQKAVKENVPGGFAVEYLDGDEDMISYVCCPFEVDVTYKKGVLEIHFTGGNGERTIDMSELSTVKAVTLN